MIEPQDNGSLEPMVRNMLLRFIRSVEKRLPEEQENQETQKAVDDENDENEENREDGTIVIPQRLWILQML
ncbi:hypothetical protein PHYBLDRAFT_157326 [Phycomyces blakesleeanus NRRL 1555(-)]|uniref:Uncharacterized protein n=1 Tax=Phycomyces blakesleeanus (strain ATCC 8743b / DSM 1359 / FGSC 10004 / NBRC 33097 / NRRL 1555) TaxID=763407 RepID=A0A167QIL9_PHYB8|nr:hypothetical protein PHYBLDRAFT_157326 [Phycomyces blakesleeanus NRRL 1555(-)]OAD79754.1 hypothetical protein PHYBLDRAFT_157326 [Phycomyces blakesleeanus NRRL 1555(-)]|eukprot:XP_018297794.1 hypothetical protein PHYBLDRAFT_157326 [Phycomyces blakesleeanus NRRL 1555(-)]